MIEAVALLVLVACIGAGILLTFMWAAGRSERAEAETGRSVNANHHDLYLLVNELLTIHRHSGVQLVFPDQDSLDQAARLTSDYRQLIVETAPRLNPGEARD